MSSAVYRRRLADTTTDVSSLEDGDEVVLYPREINERVPYPRKATFFEGGWYFAEDPLLGDPSYTLADWLLWFRGYEPLPPPVVSIRFEDVEDALLAAEDDDPAFSGDILE